jgi:hypothetical protein
MRRSALPLVANVVAILITASCTNTGSPQGGAGGNAGAGSGGATGAGGATGMGGTNGTGGATGGAAGTGSGGAGAGGGPGSGGTAGAGTGGAAGSGTGGGGAVDAGPGDAARTADGGVGQGTPSLCAGSTFAVCQDFESTQPNATPGGSWSVPTTNYGVGTLTVAADDAARGNHSLKVSIPAGGSSAEHYLQLGNLGTLASSHYGRVFVKIASPTTTQFVHWDLILGAGTYSGSARRIRWGNTGTGLGNTDSNWAWIYNVEQGDFGTEARQSHPVLASWMCIEWYWDGTAQQARFYFQGAEVQPLHIDTTLPGGSRSPEIPTFSSLSFGVAKYQSTDAPLTFWIDEIALDKQRIGCGN